jgi:predicted dehydrogenase
MLHCQRHPTRFGAAALVSLACSAAAALDPATRPSDRFRLGIVGLSHAHVYGFLNEVVRRPDIELVGMAEPRAELLSRYGRHHHKLPPSTLFADLDQMLDQARPHAVAVFTDTAGHPRVVEACARRGIHVMMEKPLAISSDDARAIQASARRGRIQVLVNYETTWYPNTRAAWSIIKEDRRVGPIRRIIFHTGHPGPKEIGVPAEFLDWLTDPLRNGSGALHDFGCYGADLATWLMDGRGPDSVTAVTQQLKSEPTYAKVDDEASILLTYPGSLVIIQASWNWPFNRKDMEIYGQSGSYLTIGSDHYRLHVADAADSQERADPPAAPHADPLSFLIAVAKGETAPTGPSSLEINLVVSEILDAARRSAQTGRTIRLTDPPVAK